MSTVFGDNGLAATAVVFLLPLGFLIVVGGYCEARWRFYSALRNWFRKPKGPPPESFDAEGDPGLVRWLERQSPILRRPDLSSKKALESWQKSLRASLLELFNVSDITSPIEVRTRRIQSTVVADQIKRIFMTFESFDGTKIPAYLFLPPCADPLPGIVVLHGHVNEDEQGITQTGGIVDSYQHGCALELAKAGYVSLTMEFRGFGYLGARVGADHHLVAYNSLLGGSFYKSILTKDIRYAVAFLQSLEQVVPYQIGMTGVSYGGEMAVTYSALDERIKAVVCQGFGVGLGGQPGVVGFQQANQQPYFYHLIPGHNRYMQQEDIFFLMAPRPMLAVWGNTDFYGTGEFFKTVEKAYECLDSSEHCGFEIVSGGHEYFLKPALQFFKNHL